MMSMTYSMKLGDFHTILFRGASHPVSSNRSFPELSCLLMGLGLFDSGSAIATNEAEGAREGDAASGARHETRRRFSRRTARASKLGAKVSGQRTRRRRPGATRDGVRRGKVLRSFDF